MMDKILSALYHYLSTFWLYNCLWVIHCHLFSKYFT